MCLVTIHNACVPNCVLERVLYPLASKSLSISTSGCSQDSNGHVGIGTDPTPGVQLQVTASSAGTKGLVVKPAPDTTSNLIEGQDSTGATVISVDSNGTLAVQATDDSIVLSTEISNVSLTSNIATITTGLNHNFRPADKVVISGLTTTVLNGTFIIVTTPTPDTFTFTLANSNISSVSDSGTAVVTKIANLHEFKINDGYTATWFDNLGGMTFCKTLTEPPARWGDNATITVRQSRNGVTGGDVAIGIYDKNFLFNETTTKTNLSLQSYFLDDGSYYSGRSLIVSQDRNKITGQISEMGGQTMIGASCDINAPAFKAQNQLDFPSEQFRYCYGAYDASDIDPNYPAGGVYSDRGFGKCKWLIGPKGETLWGTYLNPNGDSSTPEDNRLAKFWLSTSTQHLTVEGSGGNGTTSYLDLYGPPGGNSVLQLGSRGTQNAFNISTSASTSGVVSFSLGNTLIMRLYDNPIGVAGACVAIGTDDVSSVLTLDSAPSNIGVAVLTARGKVGQIGNLIQAQDSLLNNLFFVKPTGEVKAKGIATEISSVKTSAYTITASDSTVLGNASSGNFDITLPLANAVTGGRTFVIKSVGTGTVTLNSAGSDMIDGSATYPLSSQFAFVSVVSDGSSKWWIIGKG